MAIRLSIFLLINFAALGLGMLLSGSGSGSEWYFGLNKAPWTPPGWVFGSAWTLIMIFFSIFMAFAWKNPEIRNLLLILFVVQFILNVGWNPVFFNFNMAGLGLVIIALLTALIGFFLFGWLHEMKSKALFILPYFLWLLIATSLNAYIVFKN